MQVFPDYSDQRFKGYCIHCTAPDGSKPFNNDHIPSRNLLAKPYPEDLPTISICEECNTEFSTSEEYLRTLLECVISGSCDPADVRDASVCRALSGNKTLRAAMAAARREYQTLGGETRVIWEPDRRVVESALAKNARGHYFYECGEPLSGDPTRVWYTPLCVMTVTERHEFEKVPDIGAWPEVGSRLLQRVATGADMMDGWIFVQDDVYRYRICEGEETVRMVIREYLACEVSWSDHF
jgi:hypothetical protein